MELVSNQSADVPIEGSLIRLFDEDGTIYVVTGYFTTGAYQFLKPAIEAFLERKQTNELIVIVSPTVDQFAAQIGHDLRTLGEDDQVQVYKYPDGCLHAKLYLRTGSQPSAIVGSVNLTRVALKQNVELSLQIDGTDPDDEQIARLTEWVTALKDESEPLTRRDMFWPVMALNSVSVWANKARLMPRNPTAYQPMTYLILALVGLYMFSLVW